MAGFVLKEKINGEPTAKVLLTRRIDHGCERGHPWVYRNAIEEIKGNCKPGDIVDVFNNRRQFVGRGYINPKSLITIRLLTREQVAVNEEFIRDRLKRAWEYRQRFLADPVYCRLVFSESDYLPGLIVDKFGSHIVMQTATLGIDRYKGLIVSILDEMLAPEVIFERNDVPSRQLEGLDQRKGFLKGSGATLIKVRENDLYFHADIENGQKTGFFYDQRENRRFLSRIVPGAEVLDCFCFSGSFSVHAASYGAKHVLGVDVSGAAVEVARNNAILNGVENTCEFIEENAFDLLRRYSDEGKKFDVVILDPPAFTKSRGAVEGAVRGYKEINLRGLKMVRSGGYLVTCSCSYHMERGLFRDTVAQAANDAKRTVREVAYFSQAMDHPSLPAAPETNYLKFLVLEVQ